jgi:putative SOS response-associated peptidase YedK
MCGRYSVVLDDQQLQEQFSRALRLPPGGIPTNYNVAPTQQNPVIADAAADEVRLFTWGLVPFWAKDRKIGARMINARSEGIEDKPAFRQAIRRRRCLVLADSFYEWKREPGGKTPYRILPADGSLLVMAGIWEQWQPRDAPSAEPLFTYSIITGAPNAEVRPLHDRMPMLLLDETQQGRWLDQDLPLPEVLRLLATPPDGVLRSYPVSRAVNNVRNNGPELHERAEPPAG